MNTKETNGKGLHLRRFLVLLVSFPYDNQIDLLILMAYQPVKGYFMPKD